MSDLHYATTTNFKNFSKHLKILKSFSKVSNLEKYIFAIYPPTFREMGFFVQPTSAPSTNSVKALCKRFRGLRYKTTTARPRHEDYHVGPQNFRVILKHQDPDIKKTYPTLYVSHKTKTASREH